MLTSTGHAIHWTPALIREALAAFVARYHCRPLAWQWCAAYSLPTRPTVRRHGLLISELVAPYAPAPPPMMPAHRTRQWTPQRVVAAIKAFHQQQGRWPLTDDFTKAQGLPHAVTVHRLFGTLAEARRQAGMPVGGFEGHGGSGRGGGGRGRYDEHNTARRHCHTQ